MNVGYNLGRFHTKINTLNHYSIFGFGLVPFIFRRVSPENGSPHETYRKTTGHNHYEYKSVYVKHVTLPKWHIQ